MMYMPETKETPQIPLMYMSQTKERKKIHFNSKIKQTTKNYNDNWVVSCLSYNGDINDGYGDIYIGSDFDNNNVEDLNDFTVGLNVGVGVSFKKIGIDLRYERGFSENEATILNNNDINLGTIDTRVEQFILSISFVL